MPPAFVKQKYVNWPDSAPELDWLAYADPTARIGLGKATANQISRYDLMLNNVLGMPDASDRKLLWATAHSAAFRSRGPKWAKLSRFLRCDRRTVKRRYEQALIRLYYKFKK